MPGLDPDLRRTWLFGPGADRTAHETMLASGADALIVDLEDFTPPPLRDKARALLANFVKDCRDRGRLAAVRVNALETCGMLDLEAAMRAQSSAGAAVPSNPTERSCPHRRARDDDVVTGTKPSFRCRELGEIRSIGEATEKPRRRSYA